MQRGEIKRIGRMWYLRFYQNGKRTWKKLARYSDAYRSKKDVRSLADKVLAPVNSKRLEPESALTIAEFIERYYFPHVEQKRKPSTVNGYRDIFENHVRERLGKRRVYEFRTVDGQNLLDSVAQSNPLLSHKSLLRIKSFLSGVFTIAKQKGALDGENPMRGTKAEGKRSDFQGYAYTLREIEDMLVKLPEPARTVVMTAAFTGLSASEIRGLKWEDFDGDVIKIARSVWQTHVSEEGELKTEERGKNPVPVIPVLRRALEEHKKHSSSTGFVFAGEKKGFALNLDNLSRRVIHPILKDGWHGWHGFRRGLSTNLHTLGVADKVIQEILRHATVATTQAHYIVIDQSKRRAAMKRLEQAWNKQRRNRLARKKSRKTGQK